MPEPIDLALLVMRLVVAFFIVRHGVWKLGFAGGMGVDKTAAFFNATGYRPGRVFALVAAGTEIGAGLLLALGLLAPFAAAALRVRVS
ncbi:DoxX family membrane protein [Prescottella subtropica]|uniref:DoxX family membrane protein n=1 Tax=Prescottella subtropica TaxID=2545757 RepID=UPI0010F8E319